MRKIFFFYFIIPVLQFKKDDHEKMIISQTLFSYLPHFSMRRKISAMLEVPPYFSLIWGNLYFEFSKNVRMTMTVHLNIIFSTMMIKICNEITS